MAIAGLTAPYLASDPAMIVDEKHLALREGLGYYWIQGRQSFVTNIWMRETAGNPRPWPSGPVSGYGTGNKATSLRCDGQACLVHMAEGDITLVFDPAAINDCGTAAFSMSQWPARGCVSWPRYGEVRAVFLNNDDVSVISTDDGRRPWDMR